MFSLFKKSKKTTSVQPAVPVTDQELKSVTEELYKQNLELAIKNRTLSLLRKLYQISLLSLDPSLLTEKISETIRTDLSLDIVGILVFREEEDALYPLNFSKSESLSKTVETLGFRFRNLSIQNISKIKFLNDVVYNKKDGVTKNISDIWGTVLSSEQINTLTNQSQIKAVLAYPLVSENKILGITILSLNQDYDALNTHEKESIKSYTDVTAIALDKAFIYKELQDANEKLKSLDKLKTEFLSLASHQLRSPLTAIRGYASMLLENSYGEINPTQKVPIERINESSRHLALVVEDLLNVSKIEQGGLKFVFGDFDIQKSLGSLLNDLKVVAEKKGLAFSYTNDESDKVTMHGDEEKLRQVFLNLVDNSIKYTEKGSITVKLHTDIDEVVVTITDTGIGMSPETKTNLFAKFKRGSEGRLANTSGSGLGLYLAKKIVEAHHGTINADSIGLGQGSTFTITLPLHDTTLKS